ncbi:MAG: double zinc ribbon domain-containing protein [Nodosilinea sp.]
MANNLRFSEKWFNRGLWVIAFLFAYFLIGLGGTIVGDLPKIESKLSAGDFVDKGEKTILTNSLKSLKQEEEALNDKVEQAQLQLDAVHSDYQSSKQAFDTWITTRKATQSSSRDNDLIARTANLEGLRKKERKYLAAIESIQKQLLDTQQQESKIEEQILSLENASREKFKAAQNQIELRVFVYRLAFILPLLIIAAYLFRKHRKKSYWPFVWGFIFFSSFAFFVELVPYLPSYGGYVRYTVGAVVTLVAGRYVILALQKYIEQQRELEKQPDSERKKDIQYDFALTRITRAICPSCERPIAKETDNFCQHCGIQIYDSCKSCGTKNIAFSKFCFHCGRPREENPPLTTPQG